LNQNQERITDKKYLELLFLKVIQVKKQCSATEIVGALRQADVLIGQGKNVSVVCGELGLFIVVIFFMNRC
jgi:hypothetical protein